MASLTWPDFRDRLRWLDGRPLSAVVEPYRDALFRQALDTFDPDGRPRFNLILAGRAKKCWKSADLVFACISALVSDSPAGHDSEVYLLANDKDQAADDLDLAKKLVSANPVLEEWLVVKRDIIERRDGRGFLEILPAGDVVGQHGKTYRLAAYDEIHGYRNWDVLEAMQPDPHRLDSQQWITSYASIYHRPGIPLYDLLAAGKAGNDPRMLFSWYSADFTTDPEFQDLPPEQRANPSMPSWVDPTYLEQQRRRLPSHKFRRLHLNLPGLPEGAPYDVESVEAAIDRGVTVRPYDSGTSYVGFVDMSGGTSDDATLGIAHKDPEGRAVLDLIQNQGKQPPFDPNQAPPRFARTLREWGVRTIYMDQYAGDTYRHQFAKFGISVMKAPTKHELYEAFEPMLNGHRVRLLDLPKLEQQLLGLVWRGSRIDHQNGEHDDWCNAAVGAAWILLRRKRKTKATWGNSTPRFKTVTVNLDAKPGEPKYKVWETQAGAPWP